MKEDMANQSKRVTYKEFFGKKISGGKGDDLPEKNVDPKELSMGMKVEKEHTEDDVVSKDIAMDHLAEDPHYYSKLHGSGLADELKNEDGSLKIPRVQGLIGLAKIIQVGKPSNGQCADGATSGFTTLANSGTEKITAAGLTDKSAASKSVGGNIAPGEGQKQGGPNSSGTISSTPKSNEIEGQSNGLSAGPNTTGHIDATPKLNESNKDMLRAMVKEVLDEMNFDENRYASHNPDSDSHYHSGHIEHPMISKQEPDYNKDRDYEERLAKHLRSIANDDEDSEDNDGEPV